MRLEAAVRTIALVVEKIEAHDGALDGWSEVATSGSNGGVSYRMLASFLMAHYPPRRR